MRRLTISLEDDLALLAEAEVHAGRAQSVSAWVADAIRAKARARADPIADLEALERSAPTPPEVVASIARAAGLSRGVVARAIRKRRSLAARPRVA
jgi:hypothetical protein